MSPTDLQATILGSDEFYSQQGPRSADVRSRNAASGQLERAVLRRFAAVDRSAESASRRPLCPGPRNPRGGTQPQSQAGQLGELVPRLASAARLAVETINFEIGGTPQGSRPICRPNRCTTRPISCSRPPRSARLVRPTCRTPLASADRAYQAAAIDAEQSAGNGAVGRRRGAADWHDAGRCPIRERHRLWDRTGPTIRRSARRCPRNPVGSRKLWLAAAARSDRRRPAGDRIADSDAHQPVVSGLHVQRRAPRSRHAGARDSLALEPLVRSGICAIELAGKCKAWSIARDRIRSQLGTNRLPYSARLYWQSVESSLAQIPRHGGGSEHHRSRPRCLRPTPLHESLLPLLDQAASQIDVFLAGTMPLVYSIPDVPSVQADGRSLRSRVLLLRQQAGRGSRRACSSRR